LDKDLKGTMCRKYVDSCALKSLPKSSACRMLHAITHSNYHWRDTPCGGGGLPITVQDKSNLRKSADWPIWC